jgi:hypothetical protein
MHSHTFASRQARDWQGLYRAAIHETDKSLLPHRISEAEKAVLNRGRELLYEDGVTEEREQLDDALYALRAYRNASINLQKAA